MPAMEEAGGAQSAGPTPDSGAGTQGSGEAFPHARPRDVRRGETLEMPGKAGTAKVLTRAHSDGRPHQAAACRACVAAQSLLRWQHRCRDGWTWLQSTPGVTVAH